MSHNIYLKDPISNEIIQFEKRHQIRGGNYVVGGTTEAWLNVTYNYSTHYFNTIDEQKGITFIYGLTGAESIPILKKAIQSLKDDLTEDYWQPTEGNAREALFGLLLFAESRPDGIWDGD